MIKRLSSAAFSCIVALIAAGCTTSGTTTAQFSPASLDLASAPVPVVKPDTTTMGFAQASLAASETEELPTAAAFAGPSVDGKSPMARPAPAVPDEAIEAASAPAIKTGAVIGSKRDRECLMRVMYFESNRSSRDGQLAVGSVVMHRLAAGNWGKSVCGVVGAPRQFAPGVMTRRMQGDTSDLAALADAILAGKRHPALKSNVMFFHQAGLKFPYGNMHYVVVAGGNTFYYKSGRRRRG